MAPLTAVKLERLRHLRDLRAKAEQVQQDVTRYYADPVGFVRDCMIWPGDRFLTPYQCGILRSSANRTAPEPTGPVSLSAGPTGSANQPSPLSRCCGSR